MMSLYKSLFYSISISAVFSLPLLLAPSVASADCSKLDSNQQWIALFDEFNRQFSEGQYQSAIDTAMPMMEICNCSPILNFSLAVTYLKLNDLEHAKKAIDTALANTQEFYIAPDILESMKIVNQQITDDYLQAQKKEVTKEKSRVNDLHDQLVQAQKEADEARQAVAAEHTLVADNFLDRERRRYDILMWSGVGVASVGLVATLAGAILYPNNSDKNLVKNVTNPGQTTEGNSKNSYTVTLRRERLASFVLLGAGITSTVVGAFMTGIGAYYRTHSISDSVALSWRLAPTSVSVGMTF